VFKPLPEGLDYTGEIRDASHVRFLADISYVNRQGERVLEQEIFDEAFSMIANAEEFILIDMFLFNAFQGAVAEEHRPLSYEITLALIAQKAAFPDIQIHVISDPINTIYGGQSSIHFESLRNAGIEVTLTDLTRLRDSNPLYSALWRPFMQPFGNSEADTLPNPFGEGRVSLRSYLALLNFKANHRKVLLADQQGELSALVTSANPHDGSSAHGNVALQFSGPAAHDLLNTELAVLKLSQGPEVMSIPQPSAREIPQGDVSVQVVTERAVERTLLSIINNVESEDYLDVAVFYLSDWEIITALKNAAQRGAQVRVLLDPNKDAFGRVKNGVPNRPVAHELVNAGVNVRWCNTQGEQCHAKWLMHKTPSDEAILVLGSTNFTRRNMHNLNLETSVVLRGRASSQPMLDANLWFFSQWHNVDGRQFSVDYEVYANSSAWHQFLYRTMEFTGLSTF